MTRAVEPRVSAVVLAAGTSSRFSGTKQLARLGGKSLIARVLAAVPTEEVSETLVVVGHDAVSVRAEVGEHKGTRLVLNERYEEGMATSIRAGVSALSGGAAAVVILLADQPFVSRALVTRVLGTFRGQRRGIVAAAYHELVAPPVIFSRRYFPELKRLEGDQGAKSVIERHRDELTLVNVRSERALTDVDTWADLLRARRLLEG